MWFALEKNDWLGQKPDAIVCNDMVSVADLRALLPPGMRTLPIACYFHENQLTYPIPDEQVRDFQYGMTNITSALAADAVWFNSRVHMEAFLVAARRLLEKMPDCIPRGVCDAIRRKASVLYPPVELPGKNVKRDPHRIPTILWPHRWEFDKNPEPFFAELIRLAGQRVPFRLVLLGEQFREAPRVFADSWESLRGHIDHAGYIEDRAKYFELLTSCDIVVSTAIQENFGIAVVEAMLAGCQPVFPNRLAYPELLPASLHQQCLYENDEDLISALRRVLVDDSRLSAEQIDRLRSSMADRFGAPGRVVEIDHALTSLAARVH